MKHAILLLASLLCPTAVAWAADLPCGPAEKGAVELDGLLEDWKDVDGIDAGGRDANLSFTIKCNVDATTLWLVVDVRDNYFVRTAQAKPGEDHLELTLGGKKHVIFPGNAAAIKEKAPKGIKVVSSLQEKGWALEIAVPLRSVPGFRPGAPQIPYTATVADCDSKATLKTEKRIDSAGRISFAEGEGALEGFLKDRKLKTSDVFWDRPITLGRSSGGRAIMAGRYLALISDGYVFMELPFKDKKDLKDAHVLDLAGDGRQALVLRYTERGAGGARDVVAVFRADGERFQRVFAAETGKSQGANRIENKVAFVKRGKATDLVIEAGSASGFSATTYKESPAEDMIPVLLPWGDDRKARYQFRGDEYLRQ
jgi:hypothetical protein